MCPWFAVPVPRVSPELRSVALAQHLGSLSDCRLALTVTPPESGNKAWLRRRLHAAILRAQLREGRAQRAEFFGSDSDDDDQWVGAPAAALTGMCVRDGVRILESESEGWRRGAARQLRRRLIARRHARPNIKSRPPHSELRFM